MTTPLWLKALYNTIARDGEDVIFTMNDIYTTDDLQVQIHLLNKQRHLGWVLAKPQAEKGEKANATRNRSRAELLEVFNRLSKYVGDRYTTKDVANRTFSLAMPVLQKGEMHALVVKSYYDVGQALDKPGNLESKERAIWTVEARPSKDDHHDTQPCHLTGLFTSIGASPYEYWRDRWDGKEESNRIWVDSVISTVAQREDGFKFLDLERMTMDQYEADRQLFAEWHSIRTKLTQSIRNHAAHLAKVDTIACFTLGALDHSNPKTFVAHLVATTLRAEIQALRDIPHKQPQIPIVACDPAYCDSCIETLNDVLCIQASNSFGA